MPLDWSNVMRPTVAVPDPFPAPLAPSTSRIPAKVFVSTSPQQAGAVFPDGPRTPEDFETNRLADFPSSTLSYIGEAPVGADINAAVWRIYLVDESLPETRTFWAEGTAGFILRWADRASYNYSGIS